MTDREEEKKEREKKDGMLFRFRKEGTRVPRNRKNGILGRRMEYGKDGSSPV
jgi:hypothetical protein